MILILGAPRTGSTLLYQIIVNHFDVWYPANDGTFHKAEKPVSYDSYKGKTKQPYEPNEGSQILSRWFGEEEEVQRKTEMTTILDYHKPWVIKNIWNVWRVDEWVKYYPDVQFVWIRRNRHDAAESDKRTGVNGAYARFQPGMYRDAYQQNQHIDEIIASALLGHDFVQVWYEPLCEQTEWYIAILKRFLKAEYREREIPKLVAHVR